MIAISVHMLKKHVFLLLGLLIAGAAWMAAVLPQPVWLFGFGKLLYGCTAFLAITILFHAFGYPYTIWFNKNIRSVKFKRVVPWNGCFLF